MVSRHMRPHSTEIHFGFDPVLLTFFLKHFQFYCYLTLKMLNSAFIDVI